MNEDILKGKWLQVRGDVKKTWVKLTDDDLTQIDGHKDKLIGVLQERYGYNHQRASQEYDRFNKELEAHYKREHSL
jgi:uncharacterized protein YjbJ (UPF0337 family)